MARWQKVLGGTMGLFFRKSIRVGPLRFNLSKSGIGVSAGVPGFRVGTGPRGNYVQMGAGGIYYRTTLRPTRSAGPPARAQPHQGYEPISPVIPDNTVGPSIDIESAHVAELVDSSSADLLEEMRRKKKRPRLLIPAALVSLIVTWWGFANLTGTWPLVVLGFLILGCAYVHLRDVLARTVVLFYDLDETMARAYEGLHSAGKHLGTAGALWHIHAQAQVHDRRYHAGATGLSSRKATHLSWVPPPFLKTNIEVFSIPVGRQTLYFFPDRILVADPAGIGAVGYKELRVSRDDIRFVESEAVPRDTEVVGQTWRYLNKNGTPDRRFKDNQQIPICQYSELHLSTPSGLNEMLMVSRPALATYFNDHLSYLASRMPVQGIARVTPPLPA